MRHSDPIRELAMGLGQGLGLGLGNCYVAATHFLGICGAHFAFNYLFGKVVKLKKKNSLNVSKKRKIILNNNNILRVQST